MKKLLVFALVAMVAVSAGANIELDWQQQS